MANPINKSKPEIPYKMESIYVTNKHKSKTLDPDDLLLMALKLIIPKRKDLVYDPALKTLPKMDQIWCITIETKNHSAFILATNTARIDQTKFSLFMEGLKDKLFNVVKSTHEKIYFMDVLQLKTEPFHSEALFSLISNYGFSSDLPGFNASLGLFILDKFKDEDRFLPLALELMDINQPSENDLYLKLKRNNRFIKYVKKGGKLDQRQWNRLNNRGIKDLYVPSDRPLNIQLQKVNSYFQSILKEYHRTVG